MTEVIPEFAARINRPEVILDRQVELIKKRTEKPELPTGISELDKYIMGFHRQQVCIIAGRPGEGKSSLAGACALHLADQGKFVLYVSLEMPAGDILERMMCSFCDLDSEQLRRGKVPGNFIDRIKVFQDFLLKTTLRIKDGFGFEIKEIHELLDECRSRKPDVLIVDHVQKVRQGEYGSRREAITEFCFEMERMALKYNMAVILLSQLNREAIKSQKPSMEHLKESGDLEAAAATVLLLQWKTLDRSKKDLKETSYAIIIGKQRYGPSGFQVNLEFFADHSRFISHEGAEDPSAPIPESIAAKVKEAEQIFRKDTDG